MNVNSKGSSIIKEVGELASHLRSHFELAKCWPIDGYSTDQLAASLSAAFGPGSHQRAAPNRAAQFLAHHLVSRHEPDRQVSNDSELIRFTNKAAFLWLTMQPGSKVSRLLESTARTAHHRTARALEPYLDEQDLLELLRWRLWNLRLEYFDESKALRAESIVAFVATVARNLAIDQLRRLASHRFDPMPQDDQLPALTHPGESDIESFDLYRDLRRAVEKATYDIPDWLSSASIEALMDLRPREEILNDVNRHRQKSGEKAWSANAFNAFLFRLRRRIRLSFE